MTCEMIRADVWDARVRAERERETHLLPAAPDPVRTDRRAGLEPRLATATDAHLLDLLADARASHAQLARFIDELHSELSTRRARPATAA